MGLKRFFWILTILFFLAAPCCSWATVSSTTTRISYSGNDSQTVFPYTFYILEEADLVVIVRSSSGVDTVQTLTTDYTVSGEGTPSGGNVTMLTAPASGQTLIVLRAVEITQGTDYVEGHPFSADTHETALDRLTMIAQQHDEELGRAIKWQRGNTLTDTFLPNPTASYIIGFNSGADGLAAYPTTAAYTATTFDHIGNYSDSLTTAIATISTDEVTLIINKEITLTASDVVPTTLRLQFIDGGRLKFGAYDPTIPGHSIIAPPGLKIFNKNSTGNVTISDPIRVYPEWWGADPSGTDDSSTELHLAIVAAAGSPVILTGTYDVRTLDDTTITSTSINLQGQSGAVLDGNDKTPYFKISGTIPVVRMDNIYFKNMQYVILANATSDVVSEVTFTNNKVIDNKSGFNLGCRVTKAIITENRFATLTMTGEVYGVRLGNDVYADQDLMGKYTISDNEFESIIATQNGSEAHAILVTGYEAIITENIIKDVSNSGDGLGAEGIYTKCRRGVISKNILTDAGTDEGFIVIKGNNRAGVAAPRGYSVLCSNNQLYCSTGAYSGIFIATEDVLVEVNLLEGFGKYGIYTYQAVALDIDNISILNNVIRNHRGEYAIYSNHVTQVLKIDGNHILELLASEGVITDVYGIYVSNRADDGDSISVSNNIVKHDGATGATTSIRGIVLYISGTTKTFSTITFANNTVMIYDAAATEYGINIAGVGGNIYDYLSVIGNTVNSAANPFVIATATFTNMTVSGNNGFFTGTLVWDPANLVDGAGETSGSITVTGAAFGDYVKVSAPYDLQDCVATAYVQAANTIEIRLQNEHGADARDFASGTWKVSVER